MTEQDKRKFKTVPAMDMEEYKKKLRAHRRKTVRRFFIILFIVLFITGGLAIFLALRHYESFDIVSMVERSDTQATIFQEFQGNILKYSNDGALYTDVSNERIWNQTYEMSDPVTDICGDYLAIYDKKGNQIYILTPDGPVSHIETTMTIEQVSIAGQGTVAVLMGDQTNSYLMLYDKNGKELVNGAIYGEDGGYPIAVALSEDAIKLAVAMLDISDGSVKTTVAFYNFGSVGENEIDRIVSASSFSDMVIPKIDFVTNDRLIAYGDTEIAIFEGTQKPKLTQEIPFANDIKTVFHNNRYIGIVSSNNDENLTNHFIVYDMRGNKVMEKDFDLEYSSIGFLKNNEVCIANDFSCDIYTIRGSYKFHYDFDKRLYEIFSSGAGLNYTVILEDRTEKIRLK